MENCRKSPKINSCTTLIRSLYLSCKSAVSNIGTELNKQPPSPKQSIGTKESLHPSGIKIKAATSSLNLSYKRFISLSFTLLKFFTNLSKENEFNDLAFLSTHEHRSS